MIYIICGVIIISVIFIMSLAIVSGRCSRIEEQKRDRSYKP
jgi:hypothetical protein